MRTKIGQWRGVVNLRRRENQGAPPFALCLRSAGAGCMGGFAMRACALGVGFGPFHFSEAHQALNLQSLQCRGAGTEKMPGRPVRMLLH